MPLERANLLGRHVGHDAGRSHERSRNSSVLAAQPRSRARPGAVGAGRGRALGLCNRIAAEDDRAALRRGRGGAGRPAFGHLGFDATAGEGERTPTLRALAINLLGTVGADDAVRAEAARRFDASPIGGGLATAIPADIETAILAVVAELVRPGDYEAVLARYRAPATPQEEMRSLGALAVFPDVELCLRTFDLAMTEVRSQNGFMRHRRPAGQPRWAARPSGPA